MAHRMPYLIGFGLTIVSFILCCIGMGTGSWWVTTDEESVFTSAGLWQICFNGYEHTSDLIGKAYYNCWWIFFRELVYIKDWIMPPWFIAVQTLMTFALVGQFGALVMFPLSYKDVNNVRMLTGTCFLTAFIFACFIISVTIFGVMIGLDRAWMPRWDKNVLGWSYGVTVVAGFLSGFSFIAIVVYTLARKYDLVAAKYAVSGDAKRERRRETKAKLVPTV